MLKCNFKFHLKKYLIILEQYCLALVVSGTYYLIYKLHRRISCICQKMCCEEGKKNIQATSADKTGW